MALANCENGCDNSPMKIQNTVMNLWLYMFAILSLLEHWSIAQKDTARNTSKSFLNGITNPGELIVKILTFSQNFQKISCFWDSPIRLTYTLYVDETYLIQE
jgi:hypothetical protein